MTTLEDFHFDAEISVSELRKEEVLDERLRTFHRLRVRRRNDFLGVLVEADAWRALSIYVDELERQVERHESEAVRLILAERLESAQFVTATPEVIAAIDRDYRQLVGE